MAAGWEEESENKGGSITILSSIVLATNGARSHQSHSSLRTLGRQYTALRLHLSAKDDIDRDATARSRQPRSHARWEAAPQTTQVQQWMLLRCQRANQHCK